MTKTLYGIKACDTMKKARAWLDGHGVAYAFHDYKTAAIDRTRLQAWVDELGWEAVLNRAGTTFRKLPESDRQNLDAAKAVELMLAQPSMIKRPILDLGVRRIAARLYIRKWRKDSKFPLVGEDQAHEPQTQGEGAAASRIDLDEAMRHLTPPERLCISLCYGAGLSHGEAAEALGAPLGTVKSHVKRGLDKLRSRMAAPPNGGEIGRQGLG